MSLVVREEWSVDSIGGGITGTQAEIERWLDGWHMEYATEFDDTIHVQRRLVIESDWEDVEL